MQNDENWLMLRSDIYIRDKGICWVCNMFVNLKDYDLGHLIDRIKGGQDAYENLAVMHHHCNITKPRHTTLEEAMKWKLTPKYLMRRHTIQKTTSVETEIKLPIPIISVIDSTPLKYEDIILRNSKLHKVNHRPFRKPKLSPQDLEAAEQLVSEYFKIHPELLVGNINHSRSEAIRQLSNTLNITQERVREILIKHKYVNKKVVIADGSQYRYIVEHLPLLLKKFIDINGINATHKYIWSEPKLIGLTNYGIDILLYLSGLMPNLNDKNIHGIESKCHKLNIDVDKIREMVKPLLSSYNII